MSAVKIKRHKVSKYQKTAPIFLFLEGHGWERKNSKCFFTYIHLDPFRCHPSKCFCLLQFIFMLQFCWSIFFYIYNTKHFFYKIQFYMVAYKSQLYTNHVSSVGHNTTLYTTHETSLFSIVLLLSFLL